MFSDSKMIIVNNKKCEKLISFFNCAENRIVIINRFWQNILTYVLMQIELIIVKLQMQQKLSLKENFTINEILV